jgi:hypothetical protein
LERVLQTNGKGTEPHPDYLIRFSRYYASSLPRHWMRSYDASGGVVVCWYAFLICVRCGANMEAFLGVMGVGLVMRGWWA